ncbi:MAG: sensor histidine kinase [Candidatus Levyibacteriota bacterium]
MFKQAQIKLTIFYSTLFLLLFWSFSFGLYYWMDSSFGEGYISQVSQRQGDTHDTPFNAKNARVVTVAADVALDQLRNILIVLNGGLLIAIPIASWFLAKRTLRPVQQIHEQQNQFVSDASHEMRTPLAIIGGEIDVVLKKKRSAEDYKKTLISTKEETTRISHLVENLLFLAKSDQNSQVFTFENVDITDSINDVTKALHSKSQQKHITVIFNADKVTTAPVVEGHALLLRQLFFNLLDNAISYTPKNGTITILLTETKNSIKIAFRDTGIGIAPDDQHKILNRFYRVDPSRSVTKGYGLGLAIVTTILQRHHGQLHIASEVGKGSTFTIELPKA